MSGTPEGGKKAYKTNLERHGKDFYNRIGSMGGKKSQGGGFASDRELASKAGRIGGKKSKRTGVKHSAETKKKMRDAHKKWWRVKFNV